MNLENIKIAVVGLGYVGLPLAVAFGKKLPVIGFDIDEKRVNDLKRSVDESDEVSAQDFNETQIEFSSDPAILRSANFIIVAVPTPIDGFKKPDLTAIKNSAQIVGRNLTRGTVVVYESTVYPGVTEDECRPILEQASGLVSGQDFKLGYSPERIVPGDKENTIEQIVKIVSGQDQEALDQIASVYELICKSGVHRAPNIKTAEAAKIVENVQRDLNIAIINELALIFQHIGVNTDDVLEAAGTKWNFHKYQPGLVGGHCIGVDPYYLTNLVEQLGYHPELILTGRRINDYMSEHVAELMIKSLIEADKTIHNAKVLILGLTFKENIKDIRNSKVLDVIKKLKSYEIDVYAHDPMLDESVVNGFGGTYVDDLENLSGMDGIILCVKHDLFKAISANDLRRMCNSRPVLVDIKGLFKSSLKDQDDFIYKTL